MTVEWVAKSPFEAPSKFPLHFEFTMATVKQKFSLREEVNYDLGAFTKLHQGLTIDYGSELCLLNQLTPLP